MNFFKMKTMAYFLYFSITKYVLKKGIMIMSTVLNNKLTMNIEIDLISK